MTAVDTNVIVRFLTRDDAAQFRRASALFSRDDIYIPDSVWLETEWVLRYAYGLDPTEVGHAFRNLMGLSQVLVSDRLRLIRAIDWHLAGLDFADALHLACSQHVETFTTFDKSLVRSAGNLGACRPVDLSSEAGD